MQACPYVLSELKRKNTAVGIVTDDFESSTQVLLDLYELENFVTEVVGSETIVYGKLVGGGILECLKKLEVRPSDALVVGSKLKDQLAAEASGASFASFQNTNLVSDQHIEKFEDLVHLLD